MDSDLQLFGETILVKLDEVLPKIDAGDDLGKALATVYCHPKFGR